MEIKTNGAYRITILIGNYAIKIANFLHSQKAFVYGCYCNISERAYCITYNEYQNHYEKVAPSLFCSWLGIFQIQKRCEVLNRDLTLEEIEEYKYLHNGDIKKENFGYYEGELVCLDYP
jgi:hypothetical protein